MAADERAKDRDLGRGSIFERILVPTDGSETAVKAGELAFRIARVHGASVALLHVLDSEVKKDSARLGEKPEDEVAERMEKEGEAYLDQVEKLELGEVRVSRAMRTGDPHREIVDQAEDIEADLIVMGHSGRRGPRRKITGSVAERVIRFADCPVLIVRGSDGR